MGGLYIDVVIVAYRSCELLRRCLESLEQYPSGFLRVVVVDNDSRDGTVELVRTDFPHVQLIESGANIGFAQATNAGIRNGDAPFVLALNPDTNVPPGVLERLLEVFVEHPDVGICGCRLVREDGSFDHAAKRSFPTIASAIGHFLRLGRSERAPDVLRQYRAPEVVSGTVDAVNGALMLMRRSVLEEVGLFDEGYWMYMEDLDLCYRFRKAGWTTWYEPSVTAVHIKGGTSGPIRSPKLNYAFHYGMYRFYEKHYAREHTAATNLVVYVGIFTKLAFSLARSELRRQLVRVGLGRRLGRSAWRRPRHTRWIRLRRAIGRTRLGQALKRQLRGRRGIRLPTLRSSSVALPEARNDRHRQLTKTPVGVEPTSSRNVLLVSHCDFTGNSALHVYAIASELLRRGYSPALAVPGNTKSVHDLGRPPFPVLSFRDVRKGRLRFGDGRGVDLVHAFTPREPVRELTADLVRLSRCPYIVHLEDNEQAIVAGRSNPRRAPAFLSEAAGVTVVIDRLLELKPDHVPGVVVWPGFDESILSPARSREQVRKSLGLARDHLVLVYPGNLHASNLGEVRTLYAAVLQLRRTGHPAVLIRIGWDFVHRSSLPNLGDGLRELGWVARAHVAELLAAADVLVQPGCSGPYNDYRFPSKLPEFLASGRPVVLPRTNIGLHLQDGSEALLLDRGDAAEIAEKVALLAANPKLRAELGEGGRAFALRELRWSRNVDRVVDLYQLAQAGETLGLGSLA